MPETPAPTTSTSTQMVSIHCDLARAAGARQIAGRDPVQGCRAEVSEPRSIFRAWHTIRARPEFPAARIRDDISRWITQIRSQHDVLSQVWCRGSRFRRVLL